MVPGMTRTRLDPADRDPLYEQLADILRGQIGDGKLAARRAVPSKRTLVQTYGISGRTVDSAMAILKAEGLIETRRGKGLYVVPEDERPR
jgi:DNA-binding GntR family transcriptional regulator